MKALFILICSCFSWLTLWTQDTLSQPQLPRNSYQCNGYVKSLQTLTITTGKDVSSLNLIHNRLNFRWLSPSAWEARVEVRNRFFFGEQVARIPGFASQLDQQSGLVRLSKLWGTGTGTIAHSSLERAYVRYSTELWDIRLGRQRINWGISNLWNVNDIFNTYNFLDFDFEERAGADALRIQYVFKNQSSIEYAIKLSTGKNQTVTAALYKWNTAQFDIQCLAGLYHTDLVAGVGWAGRVGSLGWKGESSLFRPLRIGGDSKAAWLITTMIDRTIGDHWYLSAGALYQSDPPLETSVNTGISSSTLSPRAIFPFPFSSYLSASWQSGGPASAQCAVVFAPEGKTWLFLPFVTWNAGNSFDVDLVAQILQSQRQNIRISYSGWYLRTRWSF